MDFGIMFFSAASTRPGVGLYRLLVEAARFADRHGFACVWTPERHFHAFGGAFPNPALTSAALAMVTERLQIRAGSLVLPLHEPLRVAEDWAVVDNLSGGRVAISFGSGWNVDDFLFHPERYAERHRLLYDGLDLVRRLWRGERIRRANSFGREVEVEIFPRPLQPELPVWITASRSAETFVSAGRLGANVLTHLVGQDLEALAEKIHRYRQARLASGFDPAAGKVSLMLHTFLGPDRDEVRRRVRVPLREYLASAIDLEQMAALGGGVVSGGHRIDPHDIPPSVKEELLDLAFERYFGGASLLGTPEDGRERVWALAEAGIDEIACLIDFIDDVDAVMGSLGLLADLAASLSAAETARRAAASVGAFIEAIERPSDGEAKGAGADGAGSAR